MLNNDASFLGSGWSFPPIFSLGGADVFMVEAEEDIAQSIQIILGTSPKERTMQDDFGCGIRDFVFETMSQRVITGIKEEVKEALLLHEPRIEVEEVLLDDSKQENGVLMITIQYKVRNTNTRYNMVYPFYLNEATDI
jgi:phage baseplate assembly protein W